MISFAENVFPVATDEETKYLVLLPSTKVCNLSSVLSANKLVTISAFKIDEEESITSSNTYSAFSIYEVLMHSLHNQDMNLY